MRIAWVFTVLCAFFLPVAAQPKRSAPKPHRQVVFAVLNDGQTLEPIALVEKGKLLSPVDGGAEQKDVDQWNRSFYKPKTTYKLVFGGVAAGTAVVTGSSPTEECIRNLARIDLSSTRAKLKGKVMALATDLPVPRSGAGLRRMPTAAERSAVEDLVKKELRKQRVPAAGIRDLKYHNLTAVGIDNDGTAELIGSFWAPVSATERALLFVVVEKGDKEGYVLSYKDLKHVKESDTMSGDISNVDDGVYNELLLDILDVDGDGKSEIFTYSQSFEGAGFNVYSKKDRSWVKVFEGWNYHCGY